MNEILLCDAKIQDYVTFTRKYRIYYFQLNVKNNNFIMEKVVKYHDFFIFIFVKKNLF